MEEMLTGAGILCIVAALLTRQLQAAGRSIPVFVSSTRRQALLAALGGLLLGGAFLTHLINPTPAEGSPLRGNITPPHATEAPPSVSDSSGENPPQMSGQGASSEEPGTTHGSAIERSDHPASTEDSEDQLRSRNRERKREP